MITLTRLDNSVCLVNMESIKYIDFTPDSVLHFLNGDTMIVREPLEEIERRVLQYRSNVLARSLTPDTSTPSSLPA